MSSLAPIESSRSAPLAQIAPPQFLIIGGGKMGGAIVSGLIASKTSVAASLSADDFIVVNPGVERRRFLTETYGVRCVATVADLASVDFEVPSRQESAFCTEDAIKTDRPLIVFLAVKPQIIFDVIKEMVPLPLFQGGKTGPVFVSIAAGITTDALKAALPLCSRVIRVMPNMPLLIGAGATGICSAQKNDPAAQNVPYIAELFDCLGQAVVVEEEQLDVVCALSGSGPAYVAKMIEELSAAATEQGLSAELAQTLALQTVLGTALLLERGEYTPEHLREAVSSPGGTTLAALAAMDEKGFSESLHAGVAAAIQRSKELADS